MKDLMTVIYVIIILIIGRKDTMTGVIGAAIGANKIGANKIGIDMTRVMKDPTDNSVLI
jgi:hypothetical protein